MKHLKKLLLTAVVAVAIVCAFAFGACGEKWPESYKFTGQIVSTQSGGTADLSLELKDDASCVLIAVETKSSSKLGTWTGTWEQNKNGTVTITFNSKSSVDADAAMKVELNDREVDADSNPGMGGLSVTSTLENKINKLTIKTIIYVGTDGNWPMAMDGSLTQVVEAN